MTDTSAYYAIVEHAEQLATRTDWEQGVAEFQALEARLKALGPPSDQDERHRVWTRFDSARQRFLAARSTAISSTPTLPVSSHQVTVVAPDPSEKREKPRDLGFFGNSFVGYRHAFSFGRRDSRTQFWTSSLVGLPLGATLILAASLSFSDVMALLLLGLPVLLLACWWVLSLIAATARRLFDAGLPRIIAWAWLLIPLAFQSAMISAIALSYADARSIGGTGGMEDRFALFTVIAGVIALAVAAGIFAGCALPTGSAKSKELQRQDHTPRREDRSVSALGTGNANRLRLVLRSAFHGYTRAFDYRSPESRTEYWSFLLIGIPIGGVIIALLIDPQRSPLSIVTFIPAVLFALWWLLSVTAATWRRLRDAGASGQLALIWIWLPCAFLINMLLGTAVATVVSQPGQYWELMLVISAIWLALALANVLIACAMPTDRIVQWGYHGIAALFSLSISIFLVPLLFGVGLILWVVSAFGNRPETTKVSSSSRKINERYRKDGTWKRGRTVNVRAHERRTGRTTTSFGGDLSGLMAKHTVLSGVALIFLPMLAWRIKLAPQRELVVHKS